MTNLARLNLHLADEVLTLNAFYVNNLSFELEGPKLVSFCQIDFRSELWLEREQFPDQGYLLEKAILGREIEAISLLYQDGQLQYLTWKEDTHFQALLDDHGCLRLLWT